MERSISHVSTHSECELCLLWEREQQPTSLEYRVHMIGAKPPTNYFMISLNPAMEGRFLPFSFSLSVMGAVSTLMYGLYA